MDQFLINLSVVLAHSLMHESRCIYPREHCADFINGGDPRPPSPNESMREVLEAMQDRLPGLMQVIGGNIGGFEQNLMNARKSIAPQDAALQTQLYKEFAPALNQAGQEVARSNALAQAGTERDVLAGPGAEVIRQADKLNREIDPEFFKTREAMGKASSGLLGSLDFGDALSGAERSEVERSLARDNQSSGNLDTNSAISTISNALTFGKAGEARKNQRAQTGSMAIGAIGGVAPNMRQGIDVLQTGVGRASGPNAGGQQFKGVNDQVGQSGLGLGQNIFGSATQFGLQANDINANRRDSLDRVNETMSAQPISC